MALHATSLKAKATMLMGGKLCYSALVSRESDEEDSPCALDSARSRTTTLSAARAAAAIAAQDCMVYKMLVLLSTAKEVLTSPCWTFTDPYLPLRDLASAE